MVLSTNVCQRYAPVKIIFLTSKRRYGHCHRQLLFTYIALVLQYVRDISLVVAFSLIF